eukprot:gene16543-19649_t
MVGYTALTPYPMVGFTALTPYPVVGYTALAPYPMMAAVLDNSWRPCSERGVLEWCAELANAPERQGLVPHEEPLLEDQLSKALVLSTPSASRPPATVSHADPGCTRNSTSRRGIPGISAGPVVVEARGGRREGGLSPKH